MALTATDIKRVLQRYLDRLRRHREDLNRLNVYPVPDGDTGTNMTLTVQSVMDAVAGAESMEEVATAMAHGSLMGARGNSGVILSQILRGLADVIRDSEAVDVGEVVAALDRASRAAYEAVMRPVEGTILTVLREAAEAAQHPPTPAGTDLGAFLRAVYERAQDALERTPELLPVLKQAGVVDAGGAGFLLLLAAFLEEVSGEEVSLPARIFSAVVKVAGIAAGGDGESGVGDLRYEVMYFLDAPDEAVPAFREAWAAIGDSIVVVGGGGTWNCHIHTDDIGGAVEAGITAGRPFDIRVTDLLEQAAAEGFHAAPTFEPLPEVAAAPVGVVAVAAGDGLADLFRGLGAQGLVVGGQTMNPSLADLLAVVDSVPAGQVVVLPNNKNIIPVAERVDGATDKQVVVVPTRSIAQGLAALVAYTPDAPEAEALAADMAAAARAVRSGEVTRAVRAATTPIGAVREGDWLGIADGQVAVAEAEARDALRSLLDVLVTGDAELVTLLTGEDADLEAVKAAGEWLEAERPGVELEVAAGGQPLYPYLISVE